MGLAADTSWKGMPLAGEYDVLACRQLCLAQLARHIVHSYYYITWQQTAHGLCWTVQVLSGSCAAVKSSLFSSIQPWLALQVKSVSVFIHHLHPLLQRQHVVLSE